MADFFVRSFLAIASWVMPARSRACRSIMLNSKDSYPDSKFSANPGLLFFRLSMYRFTSLMISFSSGGNQVSVYEPTRFHGLGFSAASSKNRLSRALSRAATNASRVKTTLERLARMTPNHTLLRSQSMNSIASSLRNVVFTPDVIEKWRRAQGDC